MNITFAPLLLADKEEAKIILAQAFMREPLTKALMISERDLYHMLENYINKSVQTSPSTSVVAKCHDKIIAVGLGNVLSNELDNDGPFHENQMRAYLPSLTPIFELLNKMEIISVHEFAKLGINQNQLYHNFMIGILPEFANIKLQESITIASALLQYWRNFIKFLDCKIMIAEATNPRSISLAKKDNYQEMITARQNYAESPHPLIKQIPSNKEFLETLGFVNPTHPFNPETSCTSCCLMYKYLL